MYRGVVVCRLQGTNKLSFLKTWKFQTACCLLSKIFIERFSESLTHPPPLKGAPTVEATAIPSNTQRSRDEREILVWSRHPYLDCMYRREGGAEIPRR